MNGLGAVLVSRYRRRSLMFTSMIGVCIFLVAQTIAIANINAASWLPYVCIAALICYIIVFGIGLSHLPFFLPTGRIY